MKHSLRLKITSIFVGITVVMLVCLWLLNNCFLEDFYCRNKVNIFDENYGKLDQMMSNKNIDDNMIYLEWNKWRESQNMSVLVVRGTDWGFYKEQMTSYYERERMMRRLQQDIFNQNENKVQIIEQRENYVIQKVYDDVTETHYMECYGFLSPINGELGMFLMSIPLSAIQDSVKVANEFLIKIGIAVLAVSTVAMYMAVWSLTKPILVLSHISERMMALDFSAKYDGHDKNEIGILGNSMNAMSEQLERTITELKSANEQLKKDIEEKIQIDDMRKEFLSNVSHELKTPIALIQGYAEGLKEGISDDPESMDFYCEVIMDEADKMNKMVRKLLTLNHLEFGQDEVVMEDFDVVELIRSVLNSTNIMIQQKEADVSVLGLSMAIVSADEFKVEEVVTNYLSNALNHLNEKKKIVIYVEDIGTGYQISVFNTGDPIPEEDLEKVWIKFFKVDKARTRAYGGSGIGLSIVKAIMDSLHQKCGVYNRPDGVVFWFTLQKAVKPSQQEEI